MEKISNIWINVIPLVIFICLVKIFECRKSSDINYYEAARDDKPCNFFDTVNITDGHHNSDGSITYENITYTSEQYEMYDYIYKGPTVRRNVSTHIRGCICQQRICIRSCCSRNQHINLNTNLCVHNTNGLIKNFDVGIQHLAGTHISDLMSNEEYALTYTKTCMGYALEPHLEEDDIWVLVRHSDKVMLHWNGSDLLNDKYCIVFDEEQTLHAYVCHELDDILNKSIPDLYDLSNHFDGFNYSARRYLPIGEIN